MRMGWKIHRVLYRMIMRKYMLAFKRSWFHVIEWQIKSRFGCGIWRRTRSMRCVPRIVDNKPVWILCHEVKRFIGWHRVDLATAATIEELVPLANHRMQPAKFLRSKPDATYTAEEESASEQALTWMVKMMVDVAGDGTLKSKWEIADADDVRPQGADHGTAAASSAEEAGTQAGEEARDGQAEGGETSKDADGSDSEHSHTKEAAEAVSPERP